MKRVNFYLSILTIGVFLLTSCSSNRFFNDLIIKRKYQKGYYVSWQSNSTKESKVTKSNEYNSTKSEIVSFNTTNTENNNSLESNNLIVSTKHNPIEITGKYNNTLLNENIRNIKTSKSVNMVKSTLAKLQVEELTNDNVKGISFNAVNQNTKTKKALNAANSCKASGCKDWIVALLLCVFVGGLGIHRFYLGYTTEGIIQLLTAGGCGIWALIDLIRIATKNLKPKGGDYC